MMCILIKCRTFAKIFMREGYSSRNYKFKKWDYYKKNSLSTLFILFLRRLRKKVYTPIFAK